MAAVSDLLSCSLKCFILRFHVKWFHSLLKSDLVSNTLSKAFSSLLSNSLSYLQLQ